MDVLFFGNVVWFFSVFLGFCLGFCTFCCKYFACFCPLKCCSGFVQVSKVNFPWIYFFAFWLELLCRQNSPNGPTRRIHLHEQLRLTFTRIHFLRPIFQRIFAVFIQILQFQIRPSQAAFDSRSPNWRMSP